MSRSTVKPRSRHSSVTSPIPLVVIICTRNTALAGSMVSQGEEMVHNNCAQGVPPARADPPLITMTSPTPIASPQSSPRLAPTSTPASPNCLTNLAVTPPQPKLSKSQRKNARKKLVKQAAAEASPENVPPEILNLGPAISSPKHKKNNNSKKKKNNSKQAGRPASPLTLSHSHPSSLSLPPSSLTSPIHPQSPGSTIAKPDLPPASANISLRTYIYYLPYHPLPRGTPVPYTLGLPEHNPLNLPYKHPSEPTHTLVLTSPRNVFVDLRVLKGVRVGDADEPNQAPWEKVEALEARGIKGELAEELVGEGGAAGRTRKRTQNRERNRERLEWAFAGRSMVVEEPSDYVATGDYEYEYEYEGEGEGSRQLGNGWGGVEEQGTSNATANGYTSTSNQSNDTSLADSFGSLDIYGLPHSETETEIETDAKSTSAPASIPMLSKPRICIWHHWVDSRYPVGSESIPLDKGAIYSLLPSSSASAEADHTLEIGHAPDPNNPGRYRTHEEMWRDIPILAVPSQSSLPAVHGEGRRVCVVLRTEGQHAPYSAGGGSKYRGVIIRLGQWIQGLVKRGAVTSVERWECIYECSEASASNGRTPSSIPGFEGEDDDEGYDSEVDGEHGMRQMQIGEGEAPGQWTRRLRIGSDFLPCLATTRHEELEVGVVVQAPGCGWVVEELWEW